MAEKDKYADEIISDDELDGVSGGSSGQTADDSRFLNVLLQGRDWQPERYGQFRLKMSDYDGEIQNAWKSVGVDATIRTGNILGSGRQNTYEINGKEVSQYEAMQHAMNVVGRHLKTSDWKW